MAVANTLAYYDMATVTAVKSVLYTLVVFDGELQAMNKGFITVTLGGYFI